MAVRGKNKCRRMKKDKKKICFILGSDKESLTGQKQVRKVRVKLINQKSEIVEQMINLKNKFYFNILFKLTE